MNIRISKPQCYSAVGKKPNQEDTLFPLKGKATEQTRVFMVCDGMGGHEHGEVASACVAETVGSITAQHPLCASSDMRDAFEKALQQAYDNLDALDTSTSVKKMGTTLTFLALCTDGVLVAHIGDSRVYQLRRGQGIVHQTRDHSLISDLIASGDLCEEDAKTFPQRNVITRAVQPHQEYPSKASYSVLTDIRKGDVFFLCCDGVVEKLDNNDLCSYLLSEKSLEERLTEVEKECMDRDTRDNNTAYLIEVVDVDGGEDEVRLSVADSDTVTKGVTSRKMNKSRLLIVLLSLLMAAILALVFLFRTSGEDNKRTDGTQNTEHTQGTIQRHKK